MLDNGGILTREGVKEITPTEERMMIGGLLAMVKGLVEDYNRAAGAAVLYFCEYISVWALYALRGKNKSDHCVATGLVTVDGLAQLVEKLQNNEEVLV